jgi:transcriptional regulator with XRE-family HTH domain
MSDCAVRRSLSSRKHERFRRLLANARRRAGLTQIQLAKRVGRPQSFVSKFERGERRLDVVEFLEVAQALGIDPCRILGDIERL